MYAVYPDTVSNGVGDACCCQDRGNVDDILGVGGPIDVSDLTYLVAYLNGRLLTKGRPLFGWLSAIVTLFV